MDLNPSDADRAFRDEVRSFLARALPSDISAAMLGQKKLSREQTVRWHKILYAHGWGAPSWPVEYGGTGWTAMQRLIFDDECAMAGAPRLIPFGHNMVAPVIMKFGSTWQKERFLPKILAMDEWWCQGYSEPGSGSDLASLSTTAARGRDDGGEHYIVNGQKTWTTLGHHADWIFCLVRTDKTAKQQEGISFLLIDMKSPGVTVRPIVNMHDVHHVNEIFFDNVRVPAENLVGEENHGWTYAKYLLGHERSGFAQIGFHRRELQRAKDIAKREMQNGQPLIDDPHFRARVALLEIRLQALEIMGLRLIWDQEQGAPPGPEASIVKIFSTELVQDIGELAMDAAGPYAQPYQPEAQYLAYAGEFAGPPYAAALAATHFDNHKYTIFAGSNEIQRNIIAKMILGL
jgi:alkylation response protein AidB-like acyl-CoA dehydrogenase